MPEMMIFLYLLMCIRSNACSIQHPPETQLCFAVSQRLGQENAARFHTRLNEFNSREMLETSTLFSTLKIRIGHNLLKHGVADTICGSP